MAPKISIIVPYYDTSERRVSLHSFRSYCSKFLDSVLAVEIIVVTNSPKVQSTFDFTTDNISIVLVDEEEPLFSLPKYRNIGVVAAQSEWILLMDIDLYISINNLEKIINYLTYFPYENSFIVFPTIYLNKNVQSVGEGFDIGCFTSDYIQTYAASSSTVALRKSFYLELGGQDERFKGWGYEDWEFASRLTANYDFFPPSRNMSYFDSEGYEHINSYYGLKGMLRTYADFTRLNGFYFYHNWHQTANSFRQKENTINNKELFQKATSVYQKKGHQLPIKKRTDIDKALVFQNSPIVYNRQLLSAFNVVGCIDATDEYFDIDHSDIKILLSGVVLNKYEYQFFITKNIKVIEPFFWGLSRHVNWLINRNFPVSKSSDFKKIDQDHIKHSVVEDEVELSHNLQSNVKGVGKPQCLIIFNPDDEDSQLLLKQRALLFSLVFLYFDNYKFIWFEQDNHENLNDNLVFIDDISNLQECIFQSSVVIHLNTSLLLRSLISHKPVVVLNNFLDIFNRLHLKTLDSLDQFMLEPKILDSELYRHIIQFTSEYSLYDMKDKKYDTVYALESFEFQLRYYNIFIGEYADKQYTWSEQATVNKKIAAQYFNVLKDSDFNRSYDWGSHDTNLENKVFYKISSTFSGKNNRSKGSRITDWDKVYRRYKKFKESPKRFFEDSKYSVLNILGKFYK